MATAACIIPMDLLRRPPLPWAPSVKSGHLPSWHWYGITLSCPSSSCSSSSSSSSWSVSYPRSITGISPGISSQRLAGWWLVKSGRLIPSQPNWCSCPHPQTVSHVTFAKMVTNPHMLSSIIWLLSLMFTCEEDKILGVFSSTWEGDDWTHKSQPNLGKVTNQWMSLHPSKC